MDKYLYLAALFPVLRMETIHERIILRLLRTDDSTMTDFDEATLSSAGPSFIEDLSKLNLKKTQLLELWRKLLRNEDLTRMSSLEWSMYGPILHTLPTDLLSKINVTDLDVLEYFGTLKVLSLRQLATLGDQLRMVFGTGLLIDEKKLARSGNIICGFSDIFLESLPPNIFRALLNQGFFKNLSSCGIKKLRFFFLLGLKYRTFGPPATWNFTTVSRLGYLIAGLDATQIRKIQDNSVKGITPDVIRALPVHILKDMRLEQLKALDVPSMRAWRRHTRDVTYLLSAAVTTTAISLTSSVICLSSHIAADILI